MSEAKTTGVCIKGAGGGLIVAALVCGVFGLAGWAFDLWFFSGVPGQDWMVFYTAAQSYFDGNLPLIFNGEALTAAINQRFADWLTLPLGPHPWVYPPPFLLLLLPFGALPPLASGVSFMLAGFAAAIFTVWRYVDLGIRRWPMIGTLVLCPAVPFDVATGQNAFYTAALLVCSFGVMARRPIVSGALLGLLSVKPQLCLMAAVALLAVRQWRVLCAAAASACLLALASMAMFGLDIWRAWLDLVFGGNELYQAWMRVGRLNGISVYACASWLGAPSTPASAAQAGATLTAAGFVYWIYRQRAPEAIRLTTLLAATILAAPHASNSDAVLLGLAASIFAAATAPESRPYQLAIAAAVWISPLFNPPVLFRIGCATPLLVVMLLTAIVISVHEQKAPKARPVTVPA